MGPKIKNLSNFLAKTKQQAEQRSELQKQEVFI